MRADWRMGFPAVLKGAIDENRPFRGTRPNPYPLGFPVGYKPYVKRVKRNPQIAAFETGDHGAKEGITESACKTGEAAAHAAFYDALARAKEFVRFVDSMYPDRDAAQQVAQSEQPAPQVSGWYFAGAANNTGFFRKNSPQFAGGEIDGKPVWFEHKGGECPVPPTMVSVCVRFRDGSEDDAHAAGYWHWGHADCAGDIVAWRYA